MPSEDDPLPDPLPASGALDLDAPRRLHPASVVLGIRVGQLVKMVVLPLVTVLAGRPWLTIGLLAALTIGLLVVRVCRWQMLTYSFDGEVLELFHGVLNRRHHSIHIGRIQQVEIRRAALHRVLGFAAIRVETAGGLSEPQIDLRVLRERDATDLRAAVRAGQEAGGHVVSDETGAAQGHEVLRVPWSHVVLASVTGAGLLVLPALYVGAFQLLGDRLMPVADSVGAILGVEPVSSMPPRLGWPLVTVAVVLVLVPSVATAAFLGLLRDARYRMRRVGDDLHVSRGLLSTRESVIPLARVHLVAVERNWLRRLLGYATVRIHSAGGSISGSSRVTVPLLRSDRTGELLTEVLPTISGAPELRRHPPAAFRRLLLRWTVGAVLVIAAVWLVPALVPRLDTGAAAGARPASLVLVPVNAALAAVAYRHLGHALAGPVVAARTGLLTVTTAIAPVHKVQLITSRRTPFQRRLGLATMTASVASPGAVVAVRDARTEDVSTLHRALTRHAAATRPLDSLAGRD